MTPHDIFTVQLVAKDSTDMKDEMEWKESWIFKIEGHAASKSSYPSVVQ